MKYNLRNLVHVLNLPFFSGPKAHYLIFVYILIILAFFYPETENITSKVCINVNKYNILLKLYYFAANLL